MARLTLRPDNSCFFSHTQRANSHTPFTRTTSFQRFHFHLSSSNHTLRLSRIVSSAQQNAKETQRVSMAKAKAKVLTDLQVEEVEKQHETLSWNWPPWKNLPQRYKLIGTTSLAFIICNMDKVNLSIAIIPMSHQFGWNSSTAGLVQSSFFWGYALSQLPGGWLAKIFGGGAVLEVGVLIWSVATALVPFLAGYMPGLLLSRVLVGIGEGVSPSAATDLIARHVNTIRRALTCSSICFWWFECWKCYGASFGSSPYPNLGWESVFYIFGLLGIAWFLGFQVLEGGETQLNAESLSSAQDIMTQSWKTSLRELNGSLKDVPWKAFFQNRAVWAMIYAHFCGSWGHYNCLSWLPTFFSEELNLNLTEAAWVSILPPLASIFVTSLAAQLADNLISRGVETTVVRKICQSIAFLSPAICMTLSSLDLGLPPWEIVGILTSGLALSSFALSGLYCTHQDMSPEYASILLGITNTVGAIPGIVGVALTGYLLDSTHSWSISLFAPSIFFYVTGTIIWLAFASSKPQSFSEQN
ncbi:putative anion transporter 6, chloroplastic [Glycine soja]